MRINSQRARRKKNTKLPPVQDRPRHFAQAGKTDLCVQHAKRWGIKQNPTCDLQHFFFSESVPRLLAEKSRLFQVQRPPEKSETPSESQETHSHCLPDSLISEKVTKLCVSKAKFQKFWNFGKFQSSKKKSVTRWVAGYESPVLDK